MSEPFDVPPPDEDVAQEHEWVQRALAQARSDQPVPDDVAARLDSRLAALTTERRVSTAPRRRLGPMILAAAAVVAVIAVGVPVVRSMSGGSPSVSADSAASSSARSSTPSASPTLEPQTAAGQAGSPDGRLALGPGTLALRSTDLGADARASLPKLLAAADAYDLAGTEASSACAARPAAGTRGALVLVDGQPALVQISPVRNGVRSVTALSCTDASPLGQARISAP